MSKSIGVEIADALNNSIDDFNKRLRKEKRDWLKCVRGEIPLYIYKRGRMYSFEANPNKWDNDGYTYVGRHNMLEKDVVKLDNLSDVAKELNEIKKQRKALHRKEQNLLKKWYEWGRQ